MSAVADEKDEVIRLFNVPVGSYWQNVYYPDTVVKVVDLDVVGNGENIGVYQAPRHGMAGAYWHSNIVDFLAAHRRVIGDIAEIRDQKGFDQ